MGTMNSSNSHKNALNTSLSIPIYLKDTQIDPETHDDVSQNSSCTLTTEPSSKRGYTLCWKDLSYTVSSKTKGTSHTKDIIKGISGIARPGDMIAVLGASGAGKTTFLDVLAGRRSSSSQRECIYVNGHPAQHISMRHISRYCQQEDALFGHLTVYENLMYAAKFNLPRSMIPQERHDIVMELIHDMGLIKVKDTIIGAPFFRGCSGGQTRRVSVASQIIGLKSGILFLDEPTSGLDSVAALAVVSSISRLFKKNNGTVISTLHQPSTSILKQFSHILLIGDGKTVFFGRREDALRYFCDIGRPIPTETNPSDFYLQLANIDFSENVEMDYQALKDLVEAFEKSQLNKKLHLQIDQELTFAKPNEQKEISHARMLDSCNTVFYQTSVLVSRGLYNSVRNPMSFSFRAVSGILLALLEGTVWLRLGTSQTTVQDRLSSSFSCVGFLSFMAMAAMPVFLEERRVIQRERANGLYGAEAYVVAQFISSLPLLAFMSLTFCSIVYFLMNYQASFEKFCIFLGTLFLVHVTADSQVILFSSILPFFVGASSLSAFASALLMINAGFLMPTTRLASFWKYTIHYIDYVKYAFEILIANEFRGLTFSCLPMTALTSGSDTSDTHASPFLLNNSTATLLQNVAECFCSIPPRSQAWTPTTCEFTGDDVLKYYRYDSVDIKFGIGIIIAYLVVIKILTYLLLKYHLVQKGI